MPGHHARPLRRYGVRLADGFGAFRAAPTRADGNTCTVRLLIRLPSGGYNERPDARGQQVLAAAIQEAIKPDTR